MMFDNRTDYVIVGAGTAGCVLAARLSVDPLVKVTMLELGGMDTNPAIYDQNMNAMFSLWNPAGAENWGYTTVQQPGLGGRVVDIARGKVLGGCSSVNAMIYIRGNRRDYDDWGIGGWTYEELLPYFKKSETYHGPLSFYHGDNGPISVIDYQQPSEVSHAFVEAAATLGASRTYNDFNGESQEAGAGFYQSSRTLDGRRSSAASAFIKPNLSRKNLQVLFQTRVTRLLFEKERIRGVEYVDANGVQTIEAEREVILCCGAFESPKLLMLSGLGQASQLTKHGISVIADLPGVGRNLQDHLVLGVGFESLTPLETPELLAEAGLFTWTSQEHQHSPDLQYFFGPVPFGYQTNGPAFTFAPILVQPQSRGTVTLTSADPTALARVDPHYLRESQDLAVLHYGIRYARELAAQVAFKGLRGKELAPGATVTSGSELSDYIRQTATTVWHPAGTCRMGTDQEAVVDEQLRVYGVEGLRIVDASVMPRLVNGNPNAAVLMIAERAADMIRYEMKFMMNTSVSSTRYSTATQPL